MPVVVKEVAVHKIFSGSFFKDINLNTGSAQHIYSLIEFFLSSKHLYVYLIIPNFSF